MKKLQSNQIDRVITKRLNTDRLRRFVALMSAFVLFITMNTLKLNADTLERIPTCGYGEHIHTEDCYDASGDVVCGVEAHVHTDACYQQRPTSGAAKTRLDDYIPLNASVVLASAVDSSVTETEVDLVSKGKLASAAADDSGLSIDDQEVVEAAQESLVVEEQPEMEIDLVPETETEPEAETEIDSESETESDAEAETEAEPEVEIGERASVALDELLEEAGIETGVVSEVGVANEDAMKLAVETAEDGSITLVPLTSFDRAEIVVIAEDGDYAIALINAVVDVEEYDHNNIEETPADTEVVAEENTEVAEEQTDVETEEKADEGVENDDEEQTDVEAEEKVDDEGVENDDEEQTDVETEEKVDGEGVDNDDEEQTDVEAEEKVDEESAENDDEEQTDVEADENGAEENISEDNTIEEEEAADEAEVQDMQVVLHVDFSEVARAGIDYAEDAVVSAAGNDGVALDVAELLNPVEETQEKTTLDVSVEDAGAELQPAVNADALEVVEVSGGVTYEDGAIAVTGDGSVALTDGDSTVVVNVYNVPELVENVTDSQGSIIIEPVSDTAALPAGEAVFEPIEDEDNAEAKIAELRDEDAENPETVETDDAGIVTVRTRHVQMFDIGVNGEGDAFEPGFAVRVRADFDQPIEGQDFELYHIVDGEPVLMENAVVVSDQGATGLDFETDSFSPYAVVWYTVDFEYIDPITGETFTWRWPGNGSYSIADILAELGIAGDIEAVELNRIIDNGGAENALYLSEDGQYIISETAFHDVYELLVTVDGVVYRLVISDVEYVTDLSNTLSGLLIEGAEKQGDKYVVQAGEDYRVKLTFTENLDYQFNTNAGSTLTYTLPAGLTVPEGNRTGVVELKSTVDPNESVKSNFTIVENSEGKLELRLTWSIPGSDATDEEKEIWQKFANSQNASFFIDLPASFTEDISASDWSAGITGDVDVKNDHDVELQKNAQYDASTNTVHYYLTVKSKGVNRDVHITDTLADDANIKLDPDTLVVKYQNGNPVDTVNLLKSETGFSFDVAKMSNNETIVIEYDSKPLDLGSMTYDSATNKYGSADDANTLGVKLTTDDTPKTVTKTLEHEISGPSISKSAGTASEIDADGYRTIEWTIVANGDANQAVGGTTITDAINSASTGIMSYTGTGIIVERYTKGSDTPVSSDPITLSDFEGSKTWSWTIPTEETTPYKYVIKYFTKVKVSDLKADTDVKNDVDFGDYGHTSGSGKVGPTEDNKVGIDKEFVSVDKANKEITWNIELTVPVGGLDEAYVIDYFPTHTVLSTQKTVVDQLVEDSIKVENLRDDESYTTEDYVNENQDPSLRGVRIDFHKVVDDVLVDGLHGDTASRKINITLKTKINSDYYDEGEQAGNTYRYFTNQATFFNNYQNVTDNDSTDFSVLEPSVAKAHTDNPANNGMQNWDDGVELPCYEYLIQIYGVNDNSLGALDEFVIRDTFDAKYLTHMTLGNPAFVPKDFAMSAGDSNNPRNKLQDYENLLDLGMVSIDNDAGEIEIHIPKAYFGSIFPKNSEGEYYFTYTLSYFLTVKNKATLNLIKQEALNNEGGFTALGNAVETSFGGDSDEIDYKIDLLDKKKVGETSNAASTSGNYELYFALDINKEGQKIGDDDWVTLTDETTNLSVQYMTIKVYRRKGDNATYTDADLLPDYSVNPSGDKITYTLPNETPIHIEYTAYVKGSGTVKYSNVATLHGQTKSYSSSATFSQETGGKYTPLSMNILKHEKGDITKVLQGVTFKIYYNYPNMAADHPSVSEADKLEYKDKTWYYWQTKTTDATGKINLDETEVNGHKLTKTPDDDHQYIYLLVEQSTDGKVSPTNSTIAFKELDVNYQFQLRDEADYTHYYYTNDDVVRIANEPSDDETIEIVAEKVWAGDEDDTSRRRPVTLRLKKGLGKNAVDMGDEYAIVLDGSADEESDAYEFEGWKAKWTNLPYGQKYTVVEDTVKGYTTTYTYQVKAASGDTYTDSTAKYLEKDGKVTVTNTRKDNNDIVLEVEKIWNDGNSNHTEDVAKFQLIRTEERATTTKVYVFTSSSGDASGAAAEPIAQFTANMHSNVKLTFDYTNEGHNLMQYEDRAFTKYITESGWNYDQTFNTGDYAEIYILLPYRSSTHRVTKIEETSDGSGSGDDGDEGEGGSDTVITEFTISATDDWKWESDELPVESEDGKATYTYAIKEIEGKTGYDVTYRLGSEEGTEYDPETDTLDGTQKLVVTNSTDGVSVTAKKTWDDSEEWPAEDVKVEVQLFVKEGETYTAVSPEKKGELNSTNKTVTWDGLDVLETGKQYVVKETKILKGSDDITSKYVDPGYVAVINGTATINNVPKVDVVFKKTWEDGFAPVSHANGGNYQYNVYVLARLERYIGNLNTPDTEFSAAQIAKKAAYLVDKNNKTMGPDGAGDMPATLKSDFELTWSDLDPKAPDGTAYIYKVVEERMYFSYLNNDTASNAFNAQWISVPTDNTNITNYYNVTELDVSKVWDNDEKPTEDVTITYALYAQEKLVSTKNVAASGQEYGDKFAVKTPADGTAVPVIIEATTTDSERWTATAAYTVSDGETAVAKFENLPRYRYDSETGNLYLLKYTVEEVSIEGTSGDLTGEYAAVVGETSMGTVSISDTNEYNIDQTVTVTNKKVPTVEITATKQFTGEHSADVVNAVKAVQVTLYRQDDTNGTVEISDHKYIAVTEDALGNAIVNPAVITPDNDGTANDWADAKKIWSGLAKYVDNDSSKAVITYLVKETGVAFTLDEDNDDAPIFVSPVMFTVNGETAVTVTDNKGNAIIDNAVDVAEVTATKTWADFTEAGYKWDATFRLEVAKKAIVEDKSGTAQAAPADYVPYPDAENAITFKIEKADTETSDTASKALGDLPKYMVDEKGDVYEVSYSVTETAYNVYDSSNTLIYSYDGANFTGDKQYDENVTHDANDELEDSWVDSNINITNAETTTTTEDTIDISLTKKWDGDDLDAAVKADSSTYATFEVRRSYTRQYRDLSSIPENAQNVTVILRNSDNTDIATYTNFTQGSVLKLMGTFGQYQTGALTFGIEGTYSQMTLSNYDQSADLKQVWSGDSYTVPANQNPDTPIVFKLNNGDWSMLANGKQGIQVTDQLKYDNNVTEDPTAVASFTLPTDADVGSDGWTKTVKDLPLVELHTDDSDPTKEWYYVYGYYFVETDTMPRGYGADFVDQYNTVITKDSRIYMDNDVVTATNKELPKFRVKKGWHRLAAKYMPPVFVKITDRDKNNADIAAPYKDAAGNDVVAYDGAGNVVPLKTYTANGNTYTGYELTYDGNFEINFYNLNKAFYKVEEIGFIINGNLITFDTEVSIGQETEKVSQLFTIRYKQTDVGTDVDLNISETEAHALGSEQIVNNDNEIQVNVINIPATKKAITIYKKWLGFNESRGLDTIYPYTDATVTLQVIQKAYYMDGTPVVEGNDGWIDYGLPFVVNHTGNLETNPNHWVDIETNTWYTTLGDRNFTYYGYHKTGENPDTYALVVYDYNVREVSAQSTDSRIWWKLGRGNLTSDTNDQDYVEEPDPTVAQRKRYDVENYELGKLGVEKKWVLKDANTQASEIYFRIGSDWWYPSQNETATNDWQDGSSWYDVTDIIGRDIYDSDQSASEQASDIAYYLREGGEIRDVDGLGYVLVLDADDVTATGFTDDMSAEEAWAATISGLPVVQADVGSGEGTYGEVRYKFEEVGALINGNVVKPGTSDWPYVELNYYRRSLNDSGEQLVGNGESQQIGTGRHQLSYFKAVNRDEPSLKFHFDKGWQGYPAQGASVVMQLQALKLNSDAISLLSGANAFTAEQQDKLAALTLTVNDLTDDQIAALVNQDALWYTAEISDATKTLPNNWDYVHETDATKKAELAQKAWALDWSDIPAYWEQHVGQNELEQTPLLYRVIEVSAPGWVRMVPNSNSVSYALANKQFNGTMQNEVVDNPTTLEIEKKWNNGETEWPTGYTVNYTITQKAYIAKLHTSTEMVEDSSSGTPVQTAVTTYTYEADTTKHLYDTENYASYTVSAGEKGKLTATNNPVTLSGLPTGGMVVMTQAKIDEIKASLAEDEDALAAFEALGIEAGETYSVGYVYQVVETSVTDAANNTLPFTALSADVDCVDAEATHKATLNNNIEELKVSKVWTKDGSADGVTWPEGAQVYFNVYRVIKVNGTEVEREDTPVYSSYANSAAITALVGADAENPAAGSVVTVSGLVPLSDLSEYTATKTVSGVVNEGQTYVTDANEAVAGKVKVNTITTDYVVVEDTEHSAVPTGTSYTYIAVEGAKSGDTYTLTNDYTDVTVKKVWTKNGTTVYDGDTANDWPEGYTVGYKVIREIYVDNAKVGEEVVETSTAATALSAANPTATVSMLPKGGTWTAVAPGETDAWKDAFYSKSLNAGDTVSATYTYRVEEATETSEGSTKPATSDFTFDAIKAVFDNTAKAYVITNDLTSVKVVKEWDGYTLKTGDKVGVKLYVSTTAPGEVDMTTFTVKVGNWLDDTAAPESGSVVVTLLGSDGSTKNVTLSGPNWSEQVTVEKYDDDNSEVTWTIQSVSEANGIEDVAVWEGHNEPTNNGELQLQATGEENTINDVTVNFSIEWYYRDGTTSHAAPSKGMLYWVNYKKSGETLLEYQPGNNSAWNRTDIICNLKASDTVDVSFDPNYEQGDVNGTITKITGPDSFKGNAGTVDIVLKAVLDEAVPELRNVPATVTWESDVDDGAYIDITVDGQSQRVTKPNTSATFNNLDKNKSYTVTYSPSNGVAVKDQTTQVNGDTTSITATVAKKAEGSGSTVQLTVNVAKWYIGNSRYWGSTVKETQLESSEAKITVTVVLNDDQTEVVDTFELSSENNWSGTSKALPSGTQYQYKITSTGSELKEVTWAGGGDESVHWPGTSDATGSLYIAYQQANGSNSIGGNQAMAVRSGLKGVSLLSAASTAKTYTGTVATDTITLLDVTAGSANVTVTGKSGLPVRATCLTATEIVLSDAVDSTTGAKWSHQWNDLPKTDAEGRTLYYYVVEESAVADGSTVKATYERTAATETDPEIITITNKVEVDQKYGSLKVTKKLEGMTTDDHWTKEFKFTIKNSEGKYLNATSHQWQEGTEGAEFTVSPKTAVQFDNLPVGNYVITETSTETELEITAYEYDDTSSVTATSAEGVEVTETNDTESPATFELVNVYTPEETQISVTKAWLNSDGTTTAPTNAEVTFDLYQDGTKLDGKSITLNGETDENGETEAWKATWTGLTKYHDDDETTEYNYTVVETSFKYNNVVYTVEGDADTGFTVKTGGNETLLWSVAKSGSQFTNTLEVTDFEFSKEWYDSIDQMHNGWVDDATIEVKLERYLIYGNNIQSTDKDTYALSLTGLGSNTNMTVTDGDGSTLTVKAEPVTVTVNSEDKTVYKFTIDGLRKKGKMTIGAEEKVGTWMYVVSETTATANGETYTATYTDKAGTTRQNDTTDEGVIRNTKSAGYELPSTGGIGTTVIYTAGIALVLLAFLGLFITARKRSDGSGI